MTPEASVTIRRCAVCRINMKGRFVYVDDGIERLMGYTREELFGKSFIDFIDETEQPLVLRMFHQRNHLEANFDITRLHILTRDHQRIAANVVVSLNFIAGNPVNYQIIIDTQKTEEQTERISAGDLEYHQFIGRLLAADPLAYSAEALEALYRYFGDDACLIYQVNGETAEPMAWRSQSPLRGISVMDEPRALVQWVAMSGEEYCFLDADQARRAIERGGIAPSELICRCLLGADAYVIRVQFDETLDAETVRKQLADVRQAIQLCQRLAPQQVAAPAPDDGAGATVLSDLQTSLASAMRIAAMLGGPKSDK